MKLLHRRVYHAVWQKLTVINFFGVPFPLLLQLFLCMLRQPIEPLVQVISSDKHLEGTSFFIIFVCLLVCILDLLRVVRVRGAERRLLASGIVTRHVILEFWYG